MRSSGPLWRPRRSATAARRGLTLTEVVAGLVLLTTVLSAVFIARGRFLRQWADADLKLRATRAADDLIGGWLAGPAAAVPIDAEGSLGSVDGCRWRTRPVRRTDAERLGARVVRLEVTRAADPGGRDLLAVEFLLPADPAPSRGN